jgi:hypothetical protein
MSILGTTEFSPGNLAVLVDHDPAVTPTACGAGSVIIYNGKWYRKIDDGSTTNVRDFYALEQKVDGTAAGATNTPLSITAPVDVTKAAANAGAATEASKQDHKHDVTTAAPAATGVATLPSDGAATTLARSDHAHQSNTAPVDVTKAAAAIGNSGEPARANHKHDVSTAAPAATGVATLPSEGSATTLARSDHAHQANTAPTNTTKSAAVTGTSGEPARADHKHDISTAAPLATGVATLPSEGTLTTLARSDHVHQANTTPINITKAVAVIGTSGEPARADHKHDASTAAAVDLTDATSAEGGSSNLARADHTHSHGSRAGGALHAAAVAGVSAGFMSSADKTKLDGLSSGTRAVLMWGNSLVSATTTTRYLNPAFADATAGTTAISFRMPFACTLRNFYIRQNIGAGNGNNIVYTLLKNGVATALVVTIASTANDANDLVNTVVVAAGDRLDIEITKALSIGTSPGDILATMEAY